jgi:L-amino acid N-acyltransferase YncA
VLLEALLDDAKDAGIRDVIVVIADKGAEASIQMHKKFGFKETGRMGKVGFKYGRWLGTVTLQKKLR